ncbi:MAG: hypothetical protein J6A60_09005 [Clostridia bacterium]|nr:hypothetical protein [Clostridia bacterium]
MFMSSSTMSAAKGIGIGLAVGTAAAVATTKMMNCSGKKAYKKKMAKCMKTAEGVMNDICTMMK